MTKLTEKQAEVIEWIRANVLGRKYGHTAPRYEIKKFEVRLPAKGRAYLVIITGMIGDEDMPAEDFCRDYSHIMI